MQVHEVKEPGNDQHNEKPGLSFVNRSLAIAAAHTALRNEGLRKEHMAAPGTIEDALRHLRRALSNAMSGVNPEASTSFHSKHPHCTDQLY